jgi:hypothetical protein
MPIDDDVRDVELSQPGAQRDPALSAADDDHVGLGRPAQLLGLGLPALEPGPSAGEHPVLGAHRPPIARRFLGAGELVEGGEQGERPALPQPEHAAAATDGGLELDQGGRGPAGLGGHLGGGEAARGRHVQGRAQQLPDAGGPLDRGDVPGEGDQVAPEADGAERRSRPVDVPGGQGVLELRQTYRRRRRAGPAPLVPWSGHSAGRSIVLRERWEPAATAPTAARSPA